MDVYNLPACVPGVAVLVAPLLLPNVNPVLLTLLVGLLLDEGAVLATPAAINRQEKYTCINSNYCTKIGHMNNK